MVGSTEDPPDGPAVAATVFTAVIVYAVSLGLTLVLAPFYKLSFVSKLVVLAEMHEAKDGCLLGFLRLLRVPGMASYS